jgi:lysozyme family protein
MTASDIIEEILRVEGAAYTDRPDDRGGPTKYGITLTTFTAWRGQPCTVEQLQGLGEPEAFAIYQHRFVQAPGFGLIGNAELEGLVVDAGVQHGPVEAIKMLQRALGILADGKMGAGTVAAIDTHDPRTLRASICAARIRFYGGLVSHDPQLVRARAAGFALQADNAFGWANRIAQFVESNV